MNNDQVSEMMRVFAGQKPIQLAFEPMELVKLFGVMFLAFFLAAISAKALMK